MHVHPLFFETKEQNLIYLEFSSLCITLKRSGPLISADCYTPDLLGRLKITLLLHHNAQPARAEKRQKVSNTGTDRGHFRL